MFSNRRLRASRASRAAGVGEVAAGTHTHSGKGHPRAHPHSAACWFSGRQQRAFRVGGEGHASSPVLDGSRGGAEGWGQGGCLWEAGETFGVNVTFPSSGTESGIQSRRRICFCLFGRRACLSRLRPRPVPGWRRERRGALLEPSKCWEQAFLLHLLTAAYSHYASRMQIIIESGCGGSDYSDPGLTSH